MMIKKEINGLICHCHVRITGEPAYWHPVNRIEIPAWKGEGISACYQFRWD